MKASSIKPRRVVIANFVVAVAVILLIAKIMYDDLLASSGNTNVGSNHHITANEPRADSEKARVDLAQGFEFRPIEKNEILDYFYIDDSTHRTSFNLGNTNWDQNNVEFSNGIMVLSLDRNNDSSRPGWHGSQVVALSETSYGLYEVEMKPYVSTPGVVTAFFLYNHTSHDEIDIEFNSRNPQQVELNYFAKGVNAGSIKGLITVELEFDAFAEYHTYGFYYGVDLIIWYIDGKEVYRTDCSETPESVDSKFTAILSLWAGGNEYVEWLGQTVEPEDNTGISAYIRSVRYIPEKSIGIVPKN
ncbi:MAG: family 16 glycosylhydrolase [Candidatus Saccharimonadales bacterium]